MPSRAERLVGALVAELTDPLGLPPGAVPVADTDPADDWAACGARELTGYRDRPPLRPTGTPATATRAALAVATAYLGAELPGVEVLGERARYTGLTRNAPYSVGGAFRALPAGDGWLGLSLSRPADLDLVAALVERGWHGSPWSTVADWLRDRSCADAAERTRLLGLAAAPVPSGAPTVRRPPVVVTRGGPRTRTEHPLVVDLTALWAGPLCARLLGLGGARVVKVESVDRPDGARAGTPKFFAHLHAGHELRTLDFGREQAALRALVRAADVVLESSRPRALRQLGIDADEEVAAGTIWASITAYGRAGEDAMRIGFGDDVAAGAGLVAWADGVPVPAGDALADPLAGVHAAAAVAVGLSGERGALLDVSMHDVAVRAARGRPGPATARATR